VVCIAVPIGGFLLGVVPTIMAAVAIHACYRRRKQERASPFSFLDELPPLFSAHQRHQRTTEQNERDRSESIHLTEPPPSAAAPSPLHVSSVRFSYVTTLYFFIFFSFLIFSYSFLNSNSGLGR
jgi:hypothetical protein